MQRLMRSAVCLLWVLALACGDDDAATTDAGATGDAAAIDATPADAGDPICGMSNSGAGEEADCAVFCAPLDELACAANVRNSTCRAWCEALKEECPTRFNHFVDCSGPAPDWACVGETVIAGTCTVALDCPCIRPLLQGCAGDVAGDEPLAANEVFVEASVSECIDLEEPDPEECRAVIGTAGLGVDAAWSGGGQVGAFVAFELDDSFSAGDVQSVTLEMLSGGFTGDSDQSGEVWQVAAFSVAELSSSVPEKLGDGPVAASFGPVQSCQVTAWPLDVEVAPSTTLYLGIFPTSPNGMSYFRVGSDLAPRLRIELAP